MAEIEALLNQHWESQRAKVIAKVIESLGPEEQARPGQEDFLKTLELVYRTSYWTAISDVALGRVTVDVPVKLGLKQ